MVYMVYYTMFWFIGCNTRSLDGTLCTFEPSMESYISDDWCHLRVHGRLLVLRDAPRPPAIVSSRSVYHGFSSVLWSAWFLWNSRNFPGRYKYDCNKTSRFHQQQLFHESVYL